MKRETPSVLILEPSPLQCDLIKMALARGGMNPIVCRQPAALRGQLLEAVPDALLIDTHLPGQNGLDLIAQLQSEALLRRTRVFFLSALGFSDVVRRAAQVGARGFLVKPIDPDLLVARLRDSLNTGG